MRVLKFGGTSVADATCLARVVELIAAARAAGRITVVASAMARVTDLLVAATQGGATRHGEVVEELRRRHHACLRALAPSDALARGQLEHRLELLERELKGLAVGGVSPAARDAVLASGEKLLVPVLAAALRASGVAAAVVDSRHLIATDSRFGAAAVDLEQTRRRVAEVLGGWPKDVVAVIPGYSGADTRHRVTTLGRGGSDTSAAVLGVALGATRVEIWTDVDVVLSAPPAMVPEAHVLPRLSYAEAAAFARHGGKVLHFNTIAPCAEAGIAIVVRNTFRPQAPGTVVDDGRVSAGRLVGVTGCPVGTRGEGGAAVAAVVGDGVASMPGLPARVFTVLAGRGIAFQPARPWSSPAAWRLLVDPNRLADALRALHGALMRPGSQPVVPPPRSGYAGDWDRGERTRAAVEGEVCHG